VSRRAQEVGCSREAMYQQARRVEQAVGEAQAGGPSREALLAENPRLRKENRLLWELLEEAESLATTVRQQFAATVWAMGVSLGQIVTLLAIVLPACHVPSRATVGRWVEQAGRQAGGILTGNRSGSENLLLVIQSPYGILCHHGNITSITTRGVGTNPTRSASLYSGAGSPCGDHGIHGPHLTGAEPHVTGPAVPKLPEFLTPTIERSATAQTGTSPSESATSRRTTGSPWPYAHPDPGGRSR
jgi:hypothetical protein